MICSYASDALLSIEKTKMCMSALLAFLSRVSILLLTRDIDISILSVRLSVTR